MPFMIKLWTYRQADIRMTILRLFEVYLKAVVLGEGGSEVLGQIILPEVLAGLQDADSKVYSASLCGLATAIPYALLVTTLVDTDLTKQKYSVKSLYEQTLIPQIMAFWISEDCNQESRVQLVEVVMGMWCSIYSLGLHNHAAVKDMSATLTLTLVSVLKLSSVNERVELITKSFTKHCTNSIFCISGLLKFLPQFLLDEDAQVREAAARAISAVAFQTITLASNSDMAGESQDQQQEVDANGQPSLPAPSTPSVASSPSSTSSAHISRIRQYCEKQQSLLPPRRPIFSRSAFASERSMSGTSLKQFNGSSSHSTLDLQSSSRRSSMVSQDSYMMSEQGSLKTTPSLFTPSLTRAGSFSGDVVLTNKDSHSGLGFQASGNGLDTQLSAHVDKSPRSQESRQDAHFKAAQKTTGDFDIKAEADAHVDLEEESTNVPEEDSQSAAELELIKALEAAKAEMRARQLPLDRHTNTNPRSITRGPDSKLNNAIQGSATFGWDDAEDDEGDDWGNEDSATLNSSALQSPSSVLEQPIEDEATRRKREQEKAYKQEQLRLKRDQKQQEMQAKREARRQQLAEKQVQKKGSSNALKLGAVKTTTPGSSAPTSASKSAPPLSTLTAVSKPASGRSMIPADDEDSWDVEDGLDLLSALDQKQAGRAGTMELKDEDDELFKDLEVTYMKPAYVGGVSSAPAPVVSGLISNTPSPTLIKSSPKTLTSPVKSIHSPVSSASNFASGTGVATAAAVAPAPPASTGSLSLKPVNSPAHSRESSPVSTPKRVASPLLRTGTTGSNGSLSSINGNNKIHGNGVSATTPDTASETAVSNSPLTTTSSLALQVDEATLEEDGWGDDWQ
ncbi:hypothetical protein EDD11_004542 [Mortierella claussenii]|nr:hypothetical protein EDD11_004542 [Mortierella claussenii]